MPYRYIGYGTYIVKKDFTTEGQEVKAGKQLTVIDIWKADKMVAYKKQNGEIVVINYDDLEDFVDLDNSVEIATPAEIVKPIFNGIKALFKKIKCKNREEDQLL